MAKTSAILFSKHQPLERGSSLVGIAILTLALGFLVTGAIYLMQNYDTIHADQESADHFRNIETALNDFIAREKRFPCPAPLNLPPDTIAPDGTEFGKEGPGSCTGTLHNGTYRATGRNGAKVRIGAVPVRSLNLSDNEMMDGYGKRYFYAITESLATAGTDVKNDLGAITINTQNGNSISDAPGHIIYALISPGTDSRGAFDAQGKIILPCEAGTVAGNNCNFITNPTPTATFVLSTERNFGTGSTTFTHSFAFRANTIPYKWNTGPWDECNGVCFSGDQNRPVQCEDHHGVAVADSFCNHTPKPSGFRVCSLPPCYWDAGAWGTCTAGTGIGTTDGFGGPGNGTNLW